MALDLSSAPVAGLLAPAWFLLCWVGYTYCADGKRGQRNLTRVMHAYRALWARQMLQRDNRMVDTQVIAKSDAQRLVLRLDHGAHHRRSDRCSRRARARNGRAR
jgi:hypothetical protein